MATRKARQLGLKFPMRGGKRRGAGRKPKGPRAGVSHARRSGLLSRHPVHATMRVLPHVWNLRGPRAASTLAGAFAGGEGEKGVRPLPLFVPREPPPPPGAGGGGGGGAAPRR